MKILLIVWAIGLAECDSLDRTYLPPSGAVLAEGNPQDINVPFQFPKENYPSSFEPANDKFADGIALGIDRQGPSVTSSLEFFTNRPGNFNSDQINNIPTTTTSYDSIKTSTLSSIEIYDTTFGPSTTVSERYSPISPSLDPNLSYDQYLIQQNLKSNKSQQSNPSFASCELDSELLNKKIGFPSGNYDLQSVNYQQLQQNPSPGNNVNKYNMNNGIKAIFLDSGISSTLVPSQSFVGTSVTNIAPFSKYFSLPSSSIHFDTSYNSNVQPQRIQAENDRNAVTLNYENTLTPKGFAYNFDTSNGIHADESGTAINGVKSKGSYSFTGDDGKVYSIKYTADEHGFLPRGDHLPTAPPIPDVILRGIEQAEKNKKLGFLDDGSYDDTKYGHRRYQGLMGRITQNYNDNITVNESDIRENGKRTGTNSFETILPTNDGKDLGKTAISNYEYGEPYYSTKFNVLKMYKKDPYIVEDEKDLSTFNITNQANGIKLFNSNRIPIQFQLKNMNKKINRPVDPVNTPENEFKGDILSNSTTLNEVLIPNTEIYSEKFNLKEYTNNSQNEYNGQKEYNLGYKYTQPQIVYNENYRNNIEPQFSSISGTDKSNPDYKSYNERITGKDFTTPKISIHYQNRKPDTSSQISKEIFKYPITIPIKINSITTQNNNNGFANPIPNFYNTRLGPVKSKEETSPERVFDSKYVSTTIKPYTSQSPDTSNGNSKQFNDYPSSTVSTTALPSKISSPITFSTGIFRYSETTPRPSQIASILRPSVASGQLTSRITSRPSNSSGFVPGQQEEDFKISTIKPHTSSQELTGTRNYENPITKAGFSEGRIPDLVVSTVPRSQKSRVSPRPENIRSQSSNEKVYGEDFSGPKQFQGFDPEYGYYY